MLTEMAYICENEYDRFFALPNVNGIGIGYKEIGSINTYQLCLKVMVINKLNLDLLKEDEVIPKYYKGFITDVIEVGEIVPQADDQRYRPVPPGSQVAVQGGPGVGTLGCFITSGTGSQLSTYILSCNHVLAGTNAVPLGAIVQQPAPPNSTNAVANLTTYVPIDFTPGSQNLIDVAIAKMMPGVPITPVFLEINAAASGIASAQLGAFVKKRGRTTGYTTGTIISINATVAVNYGSLGVAVFIRQISATPMSSAGDSGSIVMDSQNRVIGLLFAGAAGRNSFMNDIRYVLRAFNAGLF